MPGLVSASDVTPKDHWLNVWCIRHTNVETLQEFQSRHRIGWIIQYLRETCVSRSLTFLLEANILWRQTPSRKKKADNCDADAGFSKVCEVFKVCGIESLKYVREFYTTVCYCDDISTPRNMTLNETNCDFVTGRMRREILWIKQARKRVFLGKAWVFDQWTISRGLDKRGKLNNATKVQARCKHSPKQQGKGLNPRYTGKNQVTGNTRQD